MVHLGDPEIQHECNIAGPIRHRCGLSNWPSVPRIHHDLGDKDHYLFGGA